MDSSQTSVSPTPSSVSSPPKDSIADSSSKEKKILPGRRQQRHSTEIGSEYHRWWVVRNALGFETNEHIAGLLLDGFHGLLHQLVQMCGVKTYQPLDGTSRNNDDSGDSGDAKLSSPSCRLMFSTSPPGVIEDMEEFIEYKNAITYYCDSLWRLYGQPDSKLHEMEGESQPVQDFLLKLMTYLRSAKGKSYSLGQKKKRLKPVSITSKKVGETNLETNVSLSALSDISPKQTSSLTLLSASCSQKMTQPNWIQGQLSPSPKSDSCKFSTASKNDSFDDSSHSAVPVDSREGPKIGPWALRGSHSPSLGSDEVTKDENERHSTFEEGYMGFQKICKKINSRESNLTVPDKALLFHNKSCNDKEQITEVALKSAGHADKSQEMTDNVCNYNTWQDIQPLWDQTLSEKQKTFKSNVYKNIDKSLHQVTPDSSWKCNTGNNSNDSDMSLDEDAGDPTPGQQYKEQYLKMLLNKSSRRKAYKSEGRKNYFSSLPQKDLLNRCVKTDSGTFPQYSSGDHSQKDIQDQKNITCPDQSCMNKETTHDAPVPTSFSVDLQTRVISSKKINLKMNSSKCKTTATNTVGTNTLNFTEMKLNSTHLKNHLHPRPKLAVSEAKSVEKSTGREMNIQPALPLNVDKSPGVSTPLGTPVIFYPANSFSSTDSSLASLSSLVQNIVCNSHGAILKPLSLAPASSSNTSFSGHQLIMSPIPTTSAENEPLHRSVAAALPVLSSQLSAGKPTLVPFYISHMNSLNGVTKYSASSSLWPSYTSIPKPIQPYLPTPQHRQQGPDLYLDKNTPTHSTSNSFRELQNSLSKSRPICDLNTTEDVKTHDYQFQNLLPASSHVESKMSPKNHSINLSKNDLFVEKFTPDLNTAEYLNLYHSKCYAPSNTAHSAVVSSGFNQESDSPVAQRPQKKILTSLLSSKSTDYNLSSPSTYNSSNCERVDTSASFNDRSTSRASTSSVSICDSSHQMVLTQDSACSESSTEKKKRCDKSRSRRLVCSTCDLMFYSGTDLLVHRYEQHSHVCGECDGRFLSVSRLRQHKESDHPVMIRCPLCRFHTFSKQGLIDHQRLEHSLEMNSTGDLQNEHRETASSCGNKASTDDCTSTQTAHQVKPNCKNISLNSRNSLNEQSVTVSSKTTENISEDISERSDNFKATDEKNFQQPLSLSVSDSILNAESLSNDKPVSSSIIKEQKQISEFSVTSVAYSRVSESCNLELVQTVDQQFSETDEPKLIIDTDMCSIKDGGGQDTETDIKETHFHPKLFLDLEEESQEDSKLRIDKTKKNVTRRRYAMLNRRKQSRLNTFRGSPADIVNRHLRNHNNGTQNSIQKGMLNSAEDENKIIDLSLPNELKEKLVMKINLKRPVNHLFDKQAVNRKKCKTKKVMKQILGAKCIKPTEVSRDMPVQRLRNIDGDCKQNDVLVLRACQELNEECSDHINKVEDSGEKTNTESLTHSMANEGKCIPHVVQECLSQSVESEENSQGTSHLSPKEEKFLSLRDRHVMSSLPPKKRKLRSSRSSKFDDVTNLPQAATNDNTELFHNDLVSTKVRENNFQLLHSDKEKTSSVSQNALLRKPLDCLRMRRSLDHRYMCPVSYCGATFSRKWNLDGHISKVHYKFSSLTCSVSGCQKTFSSKRDLRQHITMDHKGKIRKYKCSWQDCNKSFFARTHLRIHNLTHTGEKPVACDMCDYRCRQQTALVWHMRKHDSCQKDTV